MFSPKTVFIVGAGASHDFGFPTGDELRLEIARALERLLAQSVSISLDDPFVRAVYELCAANELQPEWGEYRKACSVIIAKERNSPLFGGDSGREGEVQAADMTSRQFTQSWHLPLMQLLKMEKDLNQLDTLFENTTFII